MREVQFLRVQRTDQTVVTDLLQGWYNLGWVMDNFEIDYDKDEYIFILEKE